MNTKEIMARNLSISGYGASEEQLIKIFDKLNEGEVVVLSYSMYRTAEKLGVEAFDCQKVFNFSDMYKGL